MSMRSFTEALGKVSVNDKACVRCLFGTRDPSLRRANCKARPAGCTMVLFRFRTIPGSTGSENPCSTSFLRSQTTSVAFSWAGFFPFGHVVEFSKALFFGEFSVEVELHSFG
jgi:hypothetical protein